MVDKVQVYKEGLQEALSQIDALSERYVDDEVSGYLRQISAHITGTFMEADGLSAEPTGKSQSELYESSPLFHHVWHCPMGWLDDKLVYGLGYTDADMKAWLVELRRLAGVEKPGGIRNAENRPEDSP